MKKTYFILLICLVFIIIGCAESAEDATDAKPSTIQVNAAGGAYNDNLRESVFSEFEDEFGITVIDSSPNDFGKLRAMVTSGQVEWDVCEVPAEDAFRAIELGLFEPLDFNKIDVTDHFEESYNDYMIAQAYYSTVLAYNIDYFTDEHPQSWADFWDVERFPGPRSLRDRPIDNLEIALMADGVSPEDLYPLDVERAFNKLNEIKPYITVWWDSGAQSAQILLDEEVVLAAVWNGRSYDLEFNHQAPIRTSWNQGMLKVSFWGVPKGTQNKEWAMELIAIAAQPENQAKFAQLMGYSGGNIKLYDYIDDPQVRENLPTYPANYELQANVDFEWWGENGERMMELWTEWKLE